MVTYLFIINNEMNFFENLRIFFNVISILSGTGYVTDDFGLWGKFFPYIFFIFNVHWWLCWIDSMWDKNI